MLKILSIKLKVKPESINATKGKKTNKNLLLDIISLSFHNKIIGTSTIIINIIGNMNIFIFNFTDALCKSFPILFERISTIKFIIVPKRTKKEFEMHLIYL